MQRPTLTALLALLCASAFAADDYKPGPDSMPQAGVAKGQMLKDTYLAKDGSLFPGTEREYQIYLPAGLDAARPAPFMVFQDGVIYQAPTVFDNLIAKHDIPAMIGIFIKPGVVPAANANALPRYNRSYEYDSVTDSYARFLIDEFLPAITAKHQLKLSDDPNARAIAGNSSGGICAFMVGWHRPDQFRRLFTGVGTYVGIHGADQLPVLVRKFEPKPLRVYLQSGENDNNLYCGDWWMANQTMERALTWNGYDVNHTWGTGGHNAKHATAIFPDVLRWLWKGYPDEPVKANPRGDAKWVGGQVVGDGEWEVSVKGVQGVLHDPTFAITADLDGTLVYSDNEGIKQLSSSGNVSLRYGKKSGPLNELARLSLDKEGKLYCKLPWLASDPSVVTLDRNGSASQFIGPSNEHNTDDLIDDFAVAYSGQVYVVTQWGDQSMLWAKKSRWEATPAAEPQTPLKSRGRDSTRLILSPDQTTLYFARSSVNTIESHRVVGDEQQPSIISGQTFGLLDSLGNAEPGVRSMCVDTNGWLYVATSLGIQVLDQAGRVNFILPTPQQPHDVCFGGKDLSHLFIACGDKIYKRHTKAHGYISGQMAPIKPPAPRL